MDLDAAEDGTVTAPTNLLAVGAGAKATAVAVKVHAINSLGAGTDQADDHRGQ